MKPLHKRSADFVSIIGYGTFITRKLWKGKHNVEVCLVNHFSRVKPLNGWFPYVLPSDNSFWALKFDISNKELTILDQYEGVPEGIFKRIEVNVTLKSGEMISAFLYIPTNETIFREKLDLNLDKHDRWKEEIKKYPDVIKKFPELIL